MDNFRKQMLIFYINWDLIMRISLQYKNYKYESQHKNKRRKLTKTYQKSLQAKVYSKKNDQKQMNTIIQRSYKNLPCKQKEFPNTISVEILKDNKKSSHDTRLASYAQKQQIPAKLNTQINDFRPKTAKKSVTLQKQSSKHSLLGPLANPSVLKDFLLNSTYGRNVYRNNKKVTPQKYDNIIDKLFSLTSALKSQLKNRNKSCHNQTPSFVPYRLQNNLTNMDEKIKWSKHQNNNYNQQKRKKMVRKTYNNRYQEHYEYYEHIKGKGEYIKSKKHEIDKWEGQIQEEKQNQFIFGNDIDMIKSA